MPSRWTNLLFVGLALAVPSGCTDTSAAPDATLAHGDAGVSVDRDHLEVMRRMSGPVLRRALSRPFARDGGALDAHVPSELEVPVDAGSPGVDAGDAPDAGARDAGARDAGARDAGTRDAGTRDAGTRDAGTRDAGTRDAGARDAGARDAGTRDAGARDAGTRDAGARDAGTRDAGTHDGGTPYVHDAGTTAGTSDAGSRDAGPIDGGLSPLALPVDHCVGSHVPDQLFAGEVALTFDDGPNVATTPSVLATLRAHGAPATFFINGVLVRGPAELAILDDIVADPRFALANHTWSHPSSPFLDGMSAAAAEAEVMDVDALLRARGEIGTFFRFPYLRATCATMQLVRDHGLTPVGVTVDSADWCYAAGGGTCDWADIPARFRDDMIGLVLDQLARTGGGVLLLHDYHAYTASVLDALLTAIGAAGYRFVALDDHAVFPRLNEERFLGDACRSDADCAFDPSATCHAAGFCTMPCEGTCPSRTGWAPTFCAPEAGAGACMQLAGPLNDACNYVRGSVVRSVSRYVGTSGLPVEWAVVCAPP